MEMVRAVDAAKIKHDKSKEAIQLALEGRWKDSIQLNRQILSYFPKDLETLNRLGKAHMEMGENSLARGEFQKVIDLSPHNPIAKRNLGRLSHLSNSRRSPTEGKKVIPKFFLEESGKSGITDLKNLASQDIVAGVAAGDSVILEPVNNVLVVKTQTGDTLGFVEPKLGNRLTRFIKQGIQYDAAILSAGPTKISAIIRESYRHPSLRGIYSFPTTEKTEFRGYARDSSFRYDIDGDMDDEIQEDHISMWTEDGEEAHIPKASELIAVVADHDDDSISDE
ncbi:hypothetical protein FIM12_00195 [SAR202 cluster bacterium AD-804-J14_MRT_500m]|nr:hypothetical protein [SAR202 cluster bacterium AD-804-J14_MRT_500m]